MVRQRLPVLQPEPSMLRFTTGLTKGSRRPARLMCLGASAFACAGFFWFSIAICCLGCDFLCPAGVLALSATVLPVARLGAAGWLLAGTSGLAALPCEDAKAASVSIAFFFWTAFIVFFVFSMRSRFCPQAVPATIPMRRIPVVSFI